MEPHPPAPRLEILSRLCRVGRGSAAPCSPRFVLPCPNVFGPDSDGASTNGTDRRVSVIPSPDTIDEFKISPNKIRALEEEDNGTDGKNGTQDGSGSVCSLISGNCSGPKKGSHAKTRSRERERNKGFRCSSSRLFPRGTEPIRLSGIQIAIQDAKKKAKLPPDAFFAPSRLRVRSP